MFAQPSNWKYLSQVSGWYLSSTFCVWRTSIYILSLVCDSVFKISCYTTKRNSSIRLLTAGDVQFCSGKKTKVSWTWHVPVTFWWLYMYSTAVCRSWWHYGGVSQCLSVWHIIRPAQPSQSAPRKCQWLLALVFVLVCPPVSPSVIFFLPLP